MTIEDRLRGWGAEQCRTTTPTRIPVEHFENPSRGRGYAVVGAAAVVLVLAGLIVVAQSRRQSSSSQGKRGVAGSTGSTAEIAPSPAPGMQSVTFHGLTIEFPASWRLNTTRCATPIANTVVIGDGAVAACALAPAPRVTSAQLSTFRGRYHLTAGPKRSIMLGSTPAVRVNATAAGMPATEIVVPSLDVDLLIQSPRQASIDALVTTLTVTSTDIHGCLSRSPQVELRMRATTAGAVLIAGSPTSVTTCRYLSGFLEQSRQVTGAELNPLTSMINALPAGLSVAKPNQHSPTLCHTPLDDEEYVLRVHYPDGHITDLYARLGLCGNLGISDGTHSGQRTEALISLLLTAGNANGWPSDVSPAK